MTRRPYVPPSMRNAWRATAPPARATRTSSGVPAEIVRRSASPISAGVTTGRTSGSGSPGIREEYDRLGQEVDEVDRAEHVVAHDRLRFRHLVGDRLVSIAVALEYPSRDIAR